MIQALDPDNFRKALAARLRAIATLLVAGDLPAVSDDPVHDVGAVLDRCITAVRCDLTRPRIWLLCTGVTGAFPRPDDVQAGLRTFELGSRHECWNWMLAHALGERATVRPIQVISGAVIVDVDYTARHDLHTGIQQVIRKTIPEWEDVHDLTLVAWDDQLAAFRALTTEEHRRVLQWHRDRPNIQRANRGGGDDGDEIPALIVPWKSVVVVPDVAKPTALLRLSSIAKDSGNSVVGIGYDCIPIVSNDQIPWGGAGLFVRYLSVVKHMRRVAGISETAATEFRGFASALPAQGLSGPIVQAVELASELPRPHDTTASKEAGGVPLVLAVGSFEPRKNHLGLLHAAETLWREGLQFELRLIGGMSWGKEVPAQIARLRRSGRPVAALHKVSDAILEDSYSRARFTVFASLHEGYGLPVAESLAFGTPVITSNFGSTAEIAAGGGAVVVDPRDDDALTAEIRSLLTDDVRLAELRDQIPQRTARSWQTYASELWTFLVEPELERLAAPAAAGDHA
jgi:glycosyltransferase involved in cell wall biosynthesis